MKNTIQMTVSCRNLLKVLQDDENLTWADEAELAPGNCLERGRIFPKPMGLVAEGGILLLEAFEVVGSQPKLLAGLDCAREAVVAQQPVQQQNATEKDQSPADPAALPAPWRDHGSVNAIVLYWSRGHCCDANVPNGEQKYK